jgi:hypothetical protein
MTIASNVEGGIHNSDGTSRVLIPALILVFHPSFSFINVLKSPFRAFVAHRGLLQLEADCISEDI